jgi:prophage tail gpP-like protein
MRDPDEVRLLIAGRELSGWESVDIGMSVADLADTFSLSAIFNPERADLVAAIEPYQFQPVQIKIGDEVYLTGTLEAVDFSYSASDRIVTLRGRSKTGILCDCSAEVEDTAEVTALTFAQIARAKVCGRLGITVRDDDPRSATRIIPEARAEYGESAFDYLKKLAAPHNLLLNSAYDGRLVITSGDDLVNYPTRYNLVEGDPLIISLSASFDATKRGSVYRVASQFAGASDILGEARDASVKPYRPKYKNGDTTGTTDAGTSDPGLTAARFMNECIASSMSIQAVLTGWRMTEQAGVDQSSGLRWSERKAITLKAPSVYLNKTARYIISGLSLKYDASQGRTSTLTLVPPEVYGGKLLKASKAKVDLW